MDKEQFKEDAAAWARTLVFVFFVAVGIGHFIHFMYESFKDIFEG